MKTLRLLIAGVLLITLASCGFHLRNHADLPFQTLYVDAPPGSLFGNNLRRVVTNGTTTKIAADAKSAQATVQVVAENRTKEILSLTGAGRVQELMLHYYVVFRVINADDKEFLSQTTLSLHRDLTYSDTQVIAKEQESDLLYHDMEDDAAHQVMRRLQAIQPTDMDALPATAETSAPAKQ